MSEDLRVWCFSALHLAVIHKHPTALRHLLAVVASLTDCTAVNTYNDLRQVCLLFGVHIWMASLKISDPIMSSNQSKDKNTTYIHIFFCYAVGFCSQLVGKWALGVICVCTAWCSNEWLMLSDAAAPGDPHQWGGDGGRPHLPRCGHRPARPPRQHRRPPRRHGRLPTHTIQTTGAPKTQRHVAATLPHGRLSQLWW